MLLSRMLLRLAASYLGLGALLAAPAALAAQVPFSPQPALSSGLSAPIDARLSDLDGDGDLDIVFSSRDANLVGWLEQTGSGFTQRTIESLTSPTSVLTADLDGDGDLDVAATSDSQDRVRWYENDGASPPAFTARDVSTTADGAEEVFAADVDRDGRLDLVSVAKNDDEVAWYENDGASPPGFTRIAIDEDPDAPGSGAEGFVDAGVGLLVFDPDRDGDPDVAAIGVIVAGLVREQQRARHGLDAAHGRLRPLDRHAAGERGPGPRRGPGPGRGGPQRRQRLLVRERRHTRHGELDAAGRLERGRLRDRRQRLGGRRGCGR